MRKYRQNFRKLLFRFYLLFRFQYLNVPLKFLVNILSFLFKVTRQPFKHCCQSDVPLNFISSFLLFQSESIKISKTKMFKLTFSILKYRRLIATKFEFSPFSS